MKNRSSAYILLLLCADQLVKYCAYPASKLYIPAFHYYVLGLVSWYPAANYGITLNWLSQIAPWLLAILQLSILLYLYQLKPPKYSWIWISAGALSNILDRLTYGYVIDYLSFKALGFTWPAIVNLADLYITSGIIYWIYTSNRGSVNFSGNSPTRKLQSDEV
jgi:signal peptidase II